MTFRNLSNTYGSSQQPLHIAAESGNLCSTLHNSQQLQQHQLSAGAGEHLCTRFCCFEPLFGNVFRCQTSGITHVCDQGCCERIFLDNHFDICRYVRQYNRQGCWVLHIKPYTFYSMCHILLGVFVQALQSIYTQNHPVSCLQVQQKTVSHPEAPRDNQQEKVS